MLTSKSKLKIFSLSMVTVLALSGCSGGGGAAGGGSGAVVATANINGKIRSLNQAFASGLLHGIRSFFVTGHYRSLPADVCASGTFSGAYVGGGGTEVASGSYSGNEFTVPDIPEGNELVLTFTCGGGGTLRCFAKAGDAGIYCNPVADAVLGAFESALGVGVTDSALAGKSIAKLGAAIVQASQNDSTATTAFTNAVAGCTLAGGGAAAVGACDMTAILSSPFAGAFKMMQTLASGWSVDSLFTLMVDVYGAEVDVDTFMYSEFATLMDGWFSTDFVANTRQYVSAVLTDQAAGGNTYVTQIQCVMYYNKFQSSGQLKYDPVLSADPIPKPTCKNTGAWTANGIVGASATALSAAIDAQTNGEVDISSGAVGACNNAWQTPGAFCAQVPRMKIISKYTEINRNDPLGTNHSDFYDAPHVSMINAFPELITELNTQAGINPACLTIPVGNGAPVLNTGTPSCVTWFATVMIPMKHNMSGLMGLYMYLKHPGEYGTGAATDLSLGQIYSLFVGSSLLNYKLGLQGPGLCGAQIHEPGDPADGRWVPALAGFANGLFSVESDFGSCGFTTPQISLANATADIAASTVPYSLSFEMFEHIPSAKEIHDFVFGAAYHTDYNPTGSRKFYTAAVGSPLMPIFCRMRDTVSTLPTERPLDAHVSIDCLTDVQLAAPPYSITTPPDAVTGAVSLPDGYPYTLQNYGYQGDGKGSVFALSDAKTGLQIQTASGPILVYQINAGNSACTNNGQANTVVSALLNFGWGSQTQQSAVPVYCMNMTALAQAGTFSFYNGGNVAITQINGDGTQSTWNVQQVGLHDPDASTNHGNASNISPLCYFAGTNSAISTNANTGLAATGSVGGGTVSASGEITALGTDDIVDLCSTTHGSNVKYYIVMTGGNWMSSTRTSLRAHLLSTVAGSQILQWNNWSSGTCNFACSWDSMQVSLQPKTMEIAYNTANFSNPGVNGCPDDALVCKSVAPPTAQAPVMSTQIANQSWQAKFDPYCDDRNGNGFCDCFEAGTQNLKTPGTCTLIDDAAEPTLSQPPYRAGGAIQLTAYRTLFTNFGGLGGTAITTEATNLGLLGNKLDGSYLNANSIWLDTSTVFQCQFLASGETTYRTPTQIDWQNFGSLTHVGCPASAGVAATSGPIRLIKPVAANNTYAISRPNTLIKLINYATKTVGQGITIGRTQRKFAFDEALALVALRGLMPVLDNPIYASGTVTPSAGAVVPGVIPTFQKVNISNGNDYDISSAVLRGILHPSEL